MKKILSLILVMMAVTLPVIAQESSTRRVGLEVRQTKETTTTVHRAPARINVEAWYNVENNSIDISYNGEEEGEVFLYMNGNLIDYDSIINTSLQLPSSSGLYTIEIISETWSAQGYIQL